MAVGRAHRRLLDPEALDRVQRSYRTNCPLPIPRGTDLTTSAGKRWRDLCLIFAKQIGPERLKDEIIKTRLGNVIAMTLTLERLQDEVVCGRPIDAHQLIHLEQQQRIMLRELGLAGFAYVTDENEDTVVVAEREEMGLV